jgi:starch synthase (maltosyl-transferring)
VYSGFELCENAALVPGSEEYLDSEKYQYRPRDWKHAEHVPPPLADIGPFITRLNMLRKSHPALHQLRNLRFHYSDQPEILCYSKSVLAEGGGGERDTVLVVVNIDPHHPREATVWLDLSALGASVGEGFVVADELSGQEFRWGQANYVRLDPAVTPAHIFTVKSGQVAGGPGT